MYLDMIWYGVSLKSIPQIFWSAICDIGEAVDDINFPSHTVGNDWSKKCRTAMALLPIWVLLWH
jgi:hypothetical protein